MASVFAPSSLSRLPSPHLPLHRQLSRSRRFAPISSTGASSAAVSQPKVVVTRERGKNGKLINALAQYRVACLEIPLIQHTKGPDFDCLPSILTGAAFEWVVITSPEAGSVFLEAWKDAGTPNVKVSVVGIGTASIFEEAVKSSEGRLSVAFVPSKATAKVLASELPKTGKGRCTVLYPSSAKASNEIEEGLSSRGFHVMRLNTYTTIPVHHLNQEVLEEAMSVPVLAVASPSAVKAWVNIISEQECWNNSVACIGETTALAAKRLGLQRVFYPENPGLEGYILVTSHLQFSVIYLKHILSKMLIKSTCHSSSNCLVHSSKCLF
ncbi:hypothetical protein SAY86_011738 [Trapa natans]|uniref:Uroporphyrinogen-III synthase n=1 Tax=Trapa natans TaxID=22666 RepID=A0AAN7LLH7_TRANT|nr:hypothetical protein SAY86_011738 [Trapa natans]